MIEKIYYWFHNLISKPEERGEYSSGYWQSMVRKEALILCRGTKGRVLEIGCGEGLFLNQLARQHPELEIWGIDNSATRLNQAEKRLKENNLQNVHLSIQKAPDLSFKDEYFDVVVCVNVFFNMTSIDLVKQTLSQTKRICRKSGRIIFDFRNSLNPLLKIKYQLARHYDATVKNLPLNTYRLEEIEAILQNLNLKIINNRFIGFPLKRFAPIVVIEAEKC